MTTVHVLDTSAIYVLLNKHQPPLLKTLRGAVERKETVVVPAPVLVEVGQSAPPLKKRMERVEELTSEVAPLDERLAGIAAEGLRAVTRADCKTCGKPGRPSIIDAIVMAVAANYAEVGDDPIVHTQDEGDMKKLVAARFANVRVARAT